MRPFLRRFPALGGLRLFALLCSALAGIGSVEANPKVGATAASFGIWSLGFVWDLGVGAWSFFPGASSFFQYAVIN